MTITIEVVTRDVAQSMFNLEDSDFATYLSPGHAKDFASGKVSIPPMPHRPGRPVKFHVDDLREWCRRYLQVGGDVEAVAKKKGRAV
jgi:hypothetical protein